MTPDLNVLVAASRTDHPHHGTALQWLSRALADCATGGSIELLPMVVAGFLRLVTNRKIFPQPTPIDVAIDFVESLLAVSGVNLAELGREWPTLRQFSLDHGLAANDIPDAWIAASIRTLGTRLVTFDRGFKRFLGRTEMILLRPDDPG